MHSSRSSLRILSFGAGAIGTYIGGSLALGGHKVIFLERPDVVAELRQRGLRLDMTIDERRKTSEAFLLDPSTLTFIGSLAEAFSFGLFDVALFAIKSYDTASALKAIKPYADKMPPVLCLQNGVDNEPAIASVLGTDRVIYGTLTSSVGRRAAGDIILERLRGLGIASGHPLSESLVTSLDEAMLKAHLFPCSTDMKWSKLLTNLVSNASSAILDMPPAEIFNNAGLYNLEMCQLQEALAVMTAQKINPINLPGTPVRALATLSHLPVFVRPLVARMLSSGRGSKMPSFHIDLHGGRGRSEVDWLNGAVVRAGEKYSVPTPVNRLLNDTLTALTEGAVPCSDFAHKPEKLFSLL